MSVLFADIIADAKSLADFDGTGAGASLNLDDARWSIWGNQSIEALYKKFLIWNPDLFQSSVDFTLALNEGTITPTALASDYRTFKGLTKDPDTNIKRTVHKFNYGARDQQNCVHYREAGKQLLLEPKLFSNGTYRLTYTAGPANLSTGDASATQQATSATVKAMGGAEIGLFYLNSGGTVILVLQITDHIARAGGALPGTWIWNAVSGVGATLTATATGVTVMDGVSLAAADRVLVFQPTVSANNYGYYVVTTAGAVGVAAVLTRDTTYDQPTEVTFGSSFFISSGTVNAGKRVVMDTPGTISVDGTQLSFDVAGSPQLLVDGISVGAGDKIFVLTGQPAYDGIWDVALTIGAKGSQWTLTRSAGQLAGTVLAPGYTIAVQQGTTNGNRIWSSDSGPTWAMISSTWSKLQAALDSLYEPAREWLGVRTAMRALGKEESNTGELGARLAELTQELQVYVQSMDSGDGDTAVDVDGDHRPGIYRLLVH